MYGYHERKHQFFKIYFYNPFVLKRACVLLQNGNVLNKIYQPHEAHIPYVLQFMIDYNLHGMSFINLDKIRYRYDKQLDGQDLPKELILPMNVLKTTVYAWEVDVLPEDILNVNQKSNSQIAANPGIAALWEDERALRRNCGISSQISQCLTETRTNIVPTKTHFMFKQILMEKLILSSDVDDSSISSSEALSIYPAESPDDENLLETSIIDTHTQSDSSKSMTIINKSPNDVENSFIFGEEELALLNALNDLKENAKDMEDDSVLSQQIKENDIESDEESDLSMPFNLMTPIKINAASFDDRTSADASNKMDIDDCVKETTNHLHCLDGANDSSDEELSQGCSSPKKRQNRNRLKMDSKYTPLKIITTTSPRKDISMVKGKENRELFKRNSILINFVLGTLSQRSRPRDETK